MREIKFRQRIKTGGFHYWGYIEGQGFVSPMGPVMGGESDPYTGLNDKNGKEIYEGDILSIDDSSSADYFGPYEPYFHILPVIYRYGGFCVHIDERAYGSFLDADVDHSLRDIIEDIGLEVEVIGNVYENPELMGEEE